MTFPSPWPFPSLPQFDVNMAKILGLAQANFQDSRRLRKQPTITPNGEWLIGQENLAQLVSAPAVFVVPRGLRLHDAQKTDVQLDRTLFLSNWIQLEIHCWGGDDPTGVDLSYGFSSAIELFRQVYVGFAETVGSFRVKVKAAEFRQLTDVDRQGRMLISLIGVQEYLAKDPPVLVPQATGTTQGLDALVTMNLSSADGTSTVQEAQFTVTP